MHSKMMAKGKIKVAVVGGPSFALSGLAKDVVTAAQATGEVDVTLVELGRGFRKALEGSRVLSRSDVIWFVDTSHFPRFRSWARRSSEISTIHHILEREEWKFTCLKAFRTLVTDPYTYEKVQGKGGEVRRVRTGVNARRFGVANNDKRGMARGRFCVPANAFVVGSLGAADRDHKRRDLIYGLIEQMVGGGEIHFLLAGKGWTDIPESAVSSVSVLPEGAADSEISDFYGCLDLFVSSSAVEGGPLPVAEALAAGVPVVSTDVGQVAEWFAGVEDPGVITDDIVWGANIRANLGNRSDLGHRRLRAEQARDSFSYDLLVVDYLRVWREVFESERRGELCMSPRFNQFLILAEWGLRRVRRKIAISLGARLKLR